MTITPPTQKFGAKIHFFSAFGAPVHRVSQPGLFQGISIKLEKWIPVTLVFNLADAEI